MKLLATLGFALGVATVVAGCLAFEFGMSTTDVVNVVGLGPFNGLWEPADYCFLGAILTPVGAGLVVFNLVWVALLFRHGQAVLPRRRWLVWSLVLALGVAGVGFGVIGLRSQESPRMTRADAEAARTQLVVVLTQLSEGKEVGPLTTPAYQKRESDSKQSVTYSVRTLWITSTAFHDDGQITVTGRIAAVTKTTELRLKGDILVGGGVAKVLFDPPKEVGFTARLVRGDNDRWRIDELAFQEE